MAEIGLNILSEKKNMFSYRKNKNEIVKMVTKNYYQARNYYDELVGKNQANKGFLEGYLAKVENESQKNVQKFSSEYA